MFKISIAGTPNPISVLHELTYTLSIANGGPETAANVSLTDTLPSSTIFTSVSSSQGSCSENSGTITCTLGDLAAEAVATVTIKAVPTFVSTITNSATVTATDRGLLTTVTNFNTLFTMRRVIIHLHCRSNSQNAKQGHDKRPD